MKEFPTCRFLTTAFSPSEEDTAPADLREQYNEFLTEAQQFLTTEDFFTVYDTLDTLLNDLKEELGRKKKGLYVGRSAEPSISWRSIST
jgi:hypothetical protein